jgi:hypothetical protein
MIITLIISSIISTLLYSRFNFREKLAELALSYKKTLSYHNIVEGNSNSIGESLLQMKLIISIFLKLIFIASPFILISIYLEYSKMSFTEVFLNVMNTAIIIATVAITSLMLKYGKK